jgi:general secretion pathway protein D
MKNLFKYILLFLLTIFSGKANECENRYFNINSTEQTSIIEFVEDISNYCHLNLIVEENTEKALEKTLTEVHISDQNLDEVLETVLTENNFFYYLSGTILKIGYVKTETFTLDYISSIRSGNSKTDIALGSSSSGGNTQVGSTIETNNKFDFWENLKKEISQLMRRPEDKYKADEPIINKKAGLITVSGTVKQLRRVSNYLSSLQKRLSQQVLIDVSILSVSLNKSHRTGIEWNTFYNSLSQGNSNIITNATISEVLKFLRKQGEVKSISNPKIVAMNNQPAIISVGNEYFYKIEKSKTIESDKSATTTNFSDIRSVFAGILLHITAEISNDSKITVSVNPSISQTMNLHMGSFEREIPPDLTKKQLSTVITIENGQKVIIGGLITKSRSKENETVPLLGYIPFFGNLFNSKKASFINEELVIVLTPTIM